MSTTTTTTVRTLIGRLGLVMQCLSSGGGSAALGQSEQNLSSEPKWVQPTARRQVTWMIGPDDSDDEADAAAYADLRSNSEDETESNAGLEVKTARPGSSFSTSATSATQVQKVTPRLHRTETGVANLNDMRIRQAVPTERDVTTDEDTVKRRVVAESTCSQTPDKLAPGSDARSNHEDDAHPVNK